MFDSGSAIGAVEMLSRQAMLASFRIKAVVRENSQVGVKQVGIYQKSSMIDEKDDFAAGGSFSFLLGQNTAFERIKPSSDATFFQNNNPMYCGMEILTILISVEDVGVKLSNQLCSLAPMAHLYNALRQTKLLDETWPALDHAIEINKGLLFNGSLPTTAQHIHSRYMLCVGKPVTAFAETIEDNLSHGFIGYKTQIKVKVIYKTAKSSRHIKAYLDGIDSPAKFLHSMTKLFNKGASNRNKTLTLLEMSALLRQALPEVVSRLEVDYITLSRHSTRLFRFIRAAFNSELGTENMIKDMEIGELNEKFNYFMVQLIFSEVFTASDARQVLLPQFSPSCQLSLAGAVAKKFLSAINSLPPIEPFDVVVATQIDPEQFKGVKIPKWH